MWPIEYVIESRSINLSRTCLGAEGLHVPLLSISNYLNTNKPHLSPRSIAVMLALFALKVPPFKSLKIHTSEPFILLHLHNCLNFHRNVSMISQKFAPGLFFDFEAANKPGTFDDVGFEH